MFERETHTQNNIFEKKNSKKNNASVVSFPFYNNIT